MAFLHEHHETAQIPTVRILGVIDRLGYLKCARCVDIFAVDKGYVWSDSAPHNSELCDACGRPLEAAV